MKKITVQTIKDKDKAKTLAEMLCRFYNYDVVVNITDDLFKITNSSNNRWDDVLISLSESEDNYTYLYFWENGEKEMNLAACLSRYVNAVPNPLPSTYFLVNHIDAVFCKIELGKETNVVDIAKGIHTFFEE